MDYNSFFEKVMTYIEEFFKIVSIPVSSMFIAIGISLIIGIVWLVSFLKTNTNAGMIILYAVISLVIFAFAFLIHVVVFSAFIDTPIVAYILLAFELLFGVGAFFFIHYCMKVKSFAVVIKVDILASLVMMFLVALIVKIIMLAVAGV